MACTVPLSDSVLLWLFGDSWIGPVVGNRTRNGFIYIYGTCFRRSEINRYMMLARVPEDHFLHFDRWKFYSNGSWQPDFRKASRLCDRFGAEFSVSWHHTLKKYITIYSELGMSEKIIMRTSTRPEGPWSEQQIIYHCPEAGWDKDYFCYAARAHPELSGPDELLISYLCNSTDFWKMAGDASIYRPKMGIPVPIESMDREGPRRPDRSA